LDKFGESAIPFSASFIIFSIGLSAYSLIPAFKLLDKANEDIEISEEYEKLKLI
jgi:hypothetical protein